MDCSWNSTLSRRKGIKGEDGGADERRRGDENVWNGDDNGVKARAELLLLNVAHWESGMTAIDYKHLRKVEGF